MALKLLHGTLTANISQFRNITPLVRRIVSQEREAARFGNSEPRKLYASIYLDEVKMKSRHIPIEDFKNIDKWNMKFSFPCAHNASNVIFSIHCGKAPNGRRNSMLEAKVPCGEIINNNGQYQSEVPLIDPNSDTNDAEMHESLHMKLNFDEAFNNSKIGIERAFFQEVSDSYYPLRNGCKVTLYQDAHVPDDYVKKMVNAGLVNYEPQRCWEDIFDAINKAEHFIYIAGWSFYTDITLRRDPKRPKDGGEPKLGELLKRKANAGVKVVLLLWENKARSRWRILSPILDFFGAVNTHDKETQDYFKNTGVHCILSTRSFTYTHHQKMVVLDKELPSGESKKRGITSFLGGIDLCDGRYDTPSHPLFSTLNEHKEHGIDFYQPSIKGSRIQNGGPRQPWHDVHCQLEGPVALDVYKTFVQRCEKEGKQDILVPESAIKSLIDQTSSITNHSDDRETWNVQLLRSVDSRAISGLSETAYGNGDIIIDRSIQHAYIEAIRRSKNFIYIEHQYFIGSCFDWRAGKFNPKQLGCLHLIPKELSLKIVSKIEAGERFTVYVVLPMWPEGNPRSRVVQLMLDCQKRTIEMMYNDIIGALKKKNPAERFEEIRKHAQSYLAFFWLGNREAKTDAELQPISSPYRNFHYMNAQTSRRFMIYVHSKMMIVDDEYIINGSANINQRSMDGARDTEIAIGAYQPLYLAANQDGARGQIHHFRLSLWFEHLGRYEATFLNPESEDCISRVNQLAQDNWNEYKGETLGADLSGHLLRYPIDISPDGSITHDTDETSTFPDTDASILGNQALDDLPDNDTLLKLVERV
ncbi:hypothetical protein HN51_060669 [Arachis hypogaea]|nr:phospholipase D alpha 1 [Arachis ipaensis]XP_025681194.1 phospholipase D alpha 1 [Arachis hypogaea]QHO04691.1 Phospholipase D alpha [Arachis hypogaea]